MPDSGRRAIVTSYQQFRRRKQTSVPTTSTTAATTPNHNHRSVRKRDILSRRSIMVGGRNCRNQGGLHFIIRSLDSARRYAVSPPTNIAAPPGYEFADEWKIDVTGVGVSRDELGWEYSWDGDGLGRRRRRWLRKLKVRRVEVRDAAEILREQREKEQETKPKIADTVGEKTDASKGDASKKDVTQSKSAKKGTAKAPISTISTTSVASRRGSVRRGRTNGSYAGQFTRALLRPIQDNWNFKGYGITVMKSLICGRCIVSSTTVNQL